MSEKQDCTDDKCKVILGNLDKGNKNYLLSLNAGQIDLMRANETSRKRFHKAVEKYGLRLIKILKVVEE